MFGDREHGWLRDARARTILRQPVDWLRSSQLRFREARELRSLKAQVDMSIWFQQERSMLLHELFDLYGSDKGSAVGGSPHYPWAPHSYADIYSTLFDHCRFSIQTIFECGIGTNRTELVSNMSKFGSPGASLRAWRDYFPNAQIIGADIDPSVLFREDRIRTYLVDQTSSHSIHDMWEQAGEPSLDLIVDDGLHSLQAFATLLEASWHLLRCGGLYVVEDVQVHQLESYRRYLDGYRAWVSYVILPRREKSVLADNCLIILRKALPETG
jgi:hypothetical protein